MVKFSLRFGTTRNPKQNENQVEPEELNRSTQDHVKLLSVEESNIQMDSLTSGYNSARNGASNSRTNKISRITFILVTEKREKMTKKVNVRLDNHCCMNFSTRICRPLPWNLTYASVTSHD